MNRERLGVQDALWLEMDRPTNPMVAEVVIWTATPVDLDRLRSALAERFVDRYPVFSSRPARDDSGTWWEPDPGFDLDQHIETATLADADNQADLQQLIAARRVCMLHQGRPLWQVILVERYRTGSALVFRSHHAIADGMRIVQVAMSLFDATPEGGAILAPPPAQHAARPRPEKGQSLLRGAMRLGRLTLREPLHAVRAAMAGVRQGLIRIVSAAPGFVDTARKLAFGPRNSATIWTGAAGTEKGIAWSDSLPLAAVKTVAKANHCTVNDVLTAAVAGALQEYLRSRGAHCSSVTFMVPVNLKPLDLTMPARLGNEFALVQLELPTSSPDDGAVLATVKRRMDRIKKGNEAAVAFLLQRAIAGVSRGLYEASVDLFTNRTTGVLTNVPGPPIPVYLAGALVETIIGWAPVSGNQPMSFSICSYNGRVTVGIATDTGLVPDYQTIAGGFTAAFDRIAAATPGAAQKAVPTAP